MEANTATETSARTESTSAQPILLVEDSPEDRDATVRAFRKAGLRNPIQCCEDGDEALDYLLRRGEYADCKEMLPGVILLDLNLPGTDGHDVLKHVKADARLRRIPVIVLTTSRSDVDIQRVYDAGANSYVAKPVEFVAYVEAMTRLKGYWLEINVLPKG